MKRSSICLCGGSQQGTGSPNHSLEIPPESDIELDNLKIELKEDKKEHVQTPRQKSVKATQPKAV